MNQFLAQGLDIVAERGGFAVKQATEGGWATIDFWDTREEAVAFMDEVARYIDAY